MASITPTVQEFWHNLCVDAFNNNTLANDFMLFFDGCKTTAPDGQITWKTSNPDYQYNLQQLDCNRLDDSDTFTLPFQTVNVFMGDKRKARGEWHVKRQMELKQRLQDTLRHVSTCPLDLSKDQKMALVQEFTSSHKTDLGSVPFLRGLAGFLGYQIQHKHNVVEWNMCEYILTQNDEEAMISYVRLLRGVLGLQLAYQDDDDDDTMAIDMDSSKTAATTTTTTEPKLIWRMSPDVDIHLLQDILKHLPKQKQTFEDYTKTDIPRNQTQQQHPKILQWLFDILGHCLSFLHK